MTGSQAISFALAAAVLTVLPGPDTLLVLRTTVMQGKRAAMLVTTGICTGLFVHASISSLGIAALLTHSPHGFSVLQTCGALYLGFLGLRSLLAAFDRNPPTLELATTSASSGTGVTPRLLLTGFFCNVLNPKAMLFYAALLPQFLLPTDPVFLTSIGLTAIHWLEGMAWLGFLIASLDRIRHRLLNPRTLRILEGSTGILLTGLAARMGLEYLLP
jgi:threonine/homoserine/homoserine lactone efflux protein